jgi:hypothetical protein
VAPTYRWLVVRALARVGRRAADADVERVLVALEEADSTRVDSSQIDTDAVESDVSLNAFARDVGPLPVALATAGVRVGLVSDNHVDLRPVFANHLLPDGRPWMDLVHTWVLSFELGAAKPDPADQRPHRVLDLVLPGGFRAGQGRN